MMVGECSPFIRDERGIFTCSILFLNEWDIQVGSWPNSIAKKNQKMQNLFSPTSTMVWKIEGFKYEKIWTKSLPFGYLEFSHALGGEPMPTCTPPSPAPSWPGAGARAERGRGWFLGSVLFGQGDWVRVSRIRTREPRNGTGSYRCGRETWPYLVCAHPVLEADSLLQHLERFRQELFWMIPSDKIVVTVLSEELQLLI